MNFPRPAEDNGRGIHGDSHCGNPQWREDLALAKQMGAKWYKIVAAGNNALEFCKALLDNGIMPVVRLWRDRPNPGPLPDADRRAVSEYAKIGVKYFETNNEPNLGGEWRIPIPALEKGVYARLRFEPLDTRVHCRRCSSEDREQDHEGISRRHPVGFCKQKDIGFSLPPFAAVQIASGKSTSVNSLVAQPTIGRQVRTAGDHPAHAPV